MRTKAALVYEYKKPLVIDELTLEAPRDREVLIQYRAAGLCHSDISVRDGVFRMPPLPCVPGHEGAGVVLDVGHGVTRVKPGDHVLLMWVPGSGDIRIGLKTILDLYKAGRLKTDLMISHRYCLEEINAGLADMESGRNVRGVILY